MSPIRRKPLGLVAYSLKHLRIFLPSQILFADSYHHKKRCLKTQISKIKNRYCISNYSILFHFLIRFQTGVLKRETFWAIWPRDVRNQSVIQIRIFYRYHLIEMTFYSLNLFILLLLVNNFVLTIQKICSKSRTSF